MKIRTSFSVAACILAALAFAETGSDLWKRLNETPSASLKANASELAPELLPDRVVYSRRGGGRPYITILPPEEEAEEGENQETTENSTD